jgi:hypothetical protein
MKPVSRFCIPGTPAVRRELEVQCLDGTIGKFCSKGNNQSTGMNFPVSSSGTEKTGFPPVGKKVQSLAGSDEFPLYRPAHRLNL